MAVLFGIGVVLAGLLPVLYFMALFAWQFSVLFEAGSWVKLPLTLVFTDHSLLQASKAAPVLPFIPQLPWPWLMSPDSLLPAHKLVTPLLERLHVGLLFALGGVPVIALGVRCARQHSAALRAEKQRRADQLRRVQDYRFDDSRAHYLDARREPYMGKTSDVRRVA
jgi:hypothetical protein